MTTLRRRAAALVAVRRFFEARDYLEVETPILATAGVTAPNIDSFATRYRGAGAPADERLWLQTSPEYAMKRLLAAGSGPIFQIARVFRDGECGRLHNPEFSLLEWYRPGIDHHALMDEVGELACLLLGERRLTRRSYCQVFETALGIDPLTVGVAELRRLVDELCPLGTTAELDRGALLDLLMGGVVSPGLGHDELAFVTDFPADQAALARLKPSDARLAERFELFIDGIEIANGYHELTDAAEQAARFEADRRTRTARGEAEPPAADHRLLAALVAGLPPCAGVAVGLDRLLMLAFEAPAIDSVLAFPVTRA